MASSNVQQLQKAIAEVAKRSAVDPDFRALAIRDAAAAIQKVSGIPLPTDTSFKFVDNSGSQKTIILPDLASIEDLSEVELEAVAGGDGDGDGSTPPPPPDTVTISGSWARS